MGGVSGAWGAVVRSAADLTEAATYFERAAALCPAPEVKANLADVAERCCRKADAM